MALNSKILRGSAILTLNEVVSNGCSFVRSWILARILSEGDYGIAGTLTVAFLFLEFISKMAFGQQIIASKNGGDRKFVDTGHTVQFVLGMASAILLFLLARPLAVILSVPQLADGMKLLALVPACMAFSSLGAFTYAREMHFERSVSLEVVPQILITIAAWPVALWLKDFRAFIWLQIGKAALSTLVSYVVAGRPYLFSFRKDYCREIFKFSWPLLVSGFIMLCSYQGDRLLMPRGYSLEQLGTYAVASVLAATPSFALLKIIGGTALPLMAKAAGNDPLLRTRYRLVSQLFSLCGALFALTMVVGGEQIFRVLYGNKYLGAGILAGWLASGHGIRMIRGAPTGVAWGSGETSSQMLGNIIRLIGLLLVVPVVMLKWPLYWVAIAGLVGEVLALVSQSIAVRRLHRMESSICLSPTLAAAICVLGGALVSHGLLPERGLVLTAAILLLSWAFTVMIFAKGFPEIGGEMSKLRTALEARFSAKFFPGPAAK
jgi:O-antigen/teichoic acid export membrane protein